ncbi:MAG: hypothetical protein ACKPA7_16705, partial [Sphaerospermopsis kisseleviana]
SAFVLTYQPPEKYLANTPPDLCIAVETLGVPCKQVGGSDSIVNLEREYLLQLLISAGISKFLWSGLHLAILHIFAPAASLVCLEGHRSPKISFEDKGENAAQSIQAANVWEGAQGFWYWL